MRLCWKIHTTSTPNQHHQQPIDLRLYWKIHTTSTSTTTTSNPSTCVCVGKSAPQARQTNTTNSPSTCVCVGKSTPPSRQTNTTSNPSTCVCVGKSTPPARQTNTTSTFLYACMVLEYYRLQWNYSGPPIYMWSYVLDPFSKPNCNFEIWFPSLKNLLSLSFSIVLKTLPNALVLFFDNWMAPGENLFCVSMLCSLWSNYLYIC